VASAEPVEDLLGGIQNSVHQTVKSVNGLLAGEGGASPAPAPAPAPLAEGGTTEPGITGTNPHGQGEVLDVTADIPVVEDVLGTVVVGQSRGEQDANGDYHGNVTVLSISGLGVDFSFPTDEGQTETSPLDPLNQNVFDGLCAATTVCLGLLDFSSSTDDNGSQNNFSVLSANVADDVVDAGVIESEGNISDDGTCQTANGSSNAADASVLGQIQADALQSESESEACNDGSAPTTDADSQVLNLEPVGDLATVLGCDGTTVDDPFSLNVVVLELIEGVCNGDDTNGSQTSIPYNVRRALGLGLLPDLTEQLGIAVLADAATSESHAVAPEDEAACPDPSNPDCPTDECPDASNPDCPDNTGDDCPDADNPDCPDSGVSSGGPGGPGGPSADTPDDDNSLPFTGADLGALGAIGLGVMALGLALMAGVDWCRRTVSS
jgi:hypothetical protein